MLLSGVIRTRARRLALLAVLALGLAPGAWWRTPLPEARIERLAITPLAVASLRGRPAGLRLEGLWRLESRDPFFGGYSALQLLGPGRLRAFSDKGDSLAFTLPGRGPPAPAFAALAPDPEHALFFQDIESLATDPASGRIWLGYEQMNAIRRFAPGAPARLVRPPAMRSWPGNSGAEAMVRLADGRFLVFAERGGRALLFAGDPVEGAAARAFRVAWPEGYRAADAVLLPDGRVLVLLRRVRLGWLPFASRLVIGDPRLIGREVPWRPAPFARLGDLLPRENYEALAVAEDREGLVLWLMSDDNQAAFQRTLLAKLRWRDGRAGGVRRPASPPS